MVLRFWGTAGLSKTVGMEGWRVWLRKATTALESDEAVAVAPLRRCVGQCAQARGTWASCKVKSTDPMLARPLRYPAWAC